MHARVAELTRALRKRNSPAAAAPPANTEIVVAPVADQPSEFSGHQSPSIEVTGVAAPSDVHVGPSAILTPGAVAAIEIASSGSKDASGEIEGATTAGPRKSSSKLSNRSSKRVEYQAAKDAAEEEENTRQFKDQVTWWRQAREDLKTPSSRVAEMEGEKLNPDWAISACSSVLRTLVGQDSFELYKTCCLDRDQVLLAQTAHTLVEKHLAHILMQASAFGHNLALKCLMFRNDKADAEKKVHELEQSLESAKIAEKKALHDKVAADAQVSDLEARLSATVEGSKKQVADALEQGRSDGFSAGLLAGKTEGIIEGARDFLKSPIFKMAVELQSAQFLNEGFDKCIAQVAHLQGFAEGFDQTRLDSSLDSQLQPYPSAIVPELAGEDEFASLAAELDLP
ncbi:hypothetical protein Salat_1793300 [Sesamum alatum]|uniref:Uncharacterized protein n=1 Tax=Sesamum alatum TaxID=300844 RepID=A0AAE1Y966_9LAMI|nr:hypothetical protein Salat_1793300 [Sesamum alatum]